jgi:3-deoxy-D-manno-octulosonic-acid transferase
MLFVYRILINLILLISPLIIVFRLLKKKEDYKRFKEKFCTISKKKNKREADLVSWGQCR